MSARAYTGMSAVRAGLTFGLSLSLATAPCGAADAAAADGRGRGTRIVIPVEMKAAGKLTVAIDAPDGSRVRNLVNGISYPAGRHEIAWDGYAEDRSPVAPGPYVARVATHPGLVVDYQGYFANGGEKDTWIPWGPNHRPFRQLLARGNLVAALAYFTEGGYSTSVFDAKAGAFRRGFTDRDWEAADALFAVDGATNRFYGVRCNEGKRELIVFAHSWDETPRARVSLVGAPPTLLRGAARVGETLYAVNAVSNTLDLYSFAEKPGVTEIAYRSSRPLGALAPSPLVGTDTGLVRPPATNVLQYVVSGERIYAVLDGSHQVHVYDRATRREVGRLGAPGGFRLGPWERDRLVRPTGVAIDGDGFLWVAENRECPKRLSRWDVKTGRCVYEKFGPGFYGFPGYGLDPERPTRWMAHDALWEYDPQKGVDRPVAAVLPNDADAADCPANPLPSRFLRYTWTRRAGRTFVIGQGQATVVFEFLGEGRALKPLAFLSTVHNYGRRLAWECAGGRDAPPFPAIREAWRKACPKVPEDRIDRTLGEDRSVLLWRDADGDGAVSADELEILPDAKGPVAYWGCALESLDFTFPMTDREGRNWALDFAAGEMTAAGSPPAWSLAKAWAARRPLAGRLPAGEGAFWSESASDRFGNLVTVTQTPYMLGVDRASGAVRWSFYNPYPCVHGSQKAPLPTPGDLQGILFGLGSVPYSATADVLALVNNHGRVFFLTSDGLYLDEVFTDVRVSARNDETCINGEPFGGMFAWDAANRRAVLQAGGSRTYVVRNLDRVKETRVPFAVTAEQLAAAHATPMAARPGETAKARPPEAVLPATLSWRAADRGVRISAKALADALELTWRVEDPSPWVNNGDDPTLAFKTGDCVDFQFLDASGDPVRLLLSPKKGDANGVQAVLYRHNAKGNRREFASPWRSHAVGDVSFPDGLSATVRREANAYTVTAKAPFALLDAASRPDAPRRDWRSEGLRADVGAIYGDADGKIDMLRTYWADKETGLVNDVPGEIIPNPKAWGLLRLNAAKEAAWTSPAGAKLVDRGVLVNAGGLLEVKNGEMSHLGGAAGPVWDAKRRLLYQSSGARRVTAMRLDGTRAATYALPGGSAFSEHDKLALDPAHGDVYALTGGTCLSYGWRRDGAGSVFRIAADAPDGAAATRVAQGCVAISASVRDGKLALVRKRNGTDEGAVEVSLLDVRTGKERPLATLEAPRAAHVTMADWLPDGRFALIVSGEFLHVLEKGKFGAAHGLFGVREIRLATARVLDDGGIWGVVGDTVKRIDATTFAPAPGVVMGGASGWFIGTVVSRPEIVATGICRVGERLYAVGSRENAAVYLCEWDAARGVLSPVRRLGGVTDPAHLVIDPDGFVMCDNVVWPFDAKPLETPARSLTRLPERATAVLPGGVTVHVHDTHHVGRPFVASSRLRGEAVGSQRGEDRTLPRDESEGPYRRPDGGPNWAERPAFTRLVAADDEEDRWELQAVHTNGLVRAYRVNADGMPWTKKAKYRTFTEAAPDLSRRSARDGDTVAETDAAAGTLTLWRVAEDGTRTRLAVAGGLARPTLVALSRGRVVVYESAAQRLRRYVIK